MGLGSLNFISLAEARSLALENKRLMLNGIDPLEEKKRIRIKAQLDEAQSLTFKEVAEACIKSKSHEWKTKACSLSIDFLRAFAAIPHHVAEKSVHRFIFTKQPLASS